MTSFEQYVRITRGTIPVLLSVPHGGTIELNTIPTRKKGVLGIDKNTIELAEDLIYSIQNLSVQTFKSQYTSSYVISEIHRNKIDMNREESEAYERSSILARDIYEFYHTSILKLIQYNLHTFKRSFLIDIHGFEKHKRPPGFRDVDIVLGTNNLASMDSEFITRKHRKNNIRGKLIKIFMDSNISIAPGHPRRDEYILTGGYITQKYGYSRIPGSIAMQIEFSDQIRLYDKSLRKKVLQLLTQFLVSNYIE